MNENEKLDPKLDPNRQELEAYTKLMNRAYMQTIEIDDLGEMCSSLETLLNGVTSTLRDDYYRQVYLYSTKSNKDIFLFLQLEMTRDNIGESLIIAENIYHADKVVNAESLRSDCKDFAEAMKPYDVTIPTQRKALRGTMITDVDYRALSMIKRIYDAKKSQANLRISRDDEDYEEIIYYMNAMNLLADRAHFILNYYDDCLFNHDPRNGLGGNVKPKLWWDEQFGHIFE